MHDDRMEALAGLGDDGEALLRRSRSAVRAPAEPGSDPTGSVTATLDERGRVATVGVAARWRSDLAGERLGEAAEVRRHRLLSGSLAAGGHTVTAARTQNGGNTLLAVVGIAAASADGVLAVLGAAAWQSYRDGGLAAEQAGPFIVMGVSAMVGAVLAFLAMIALLRGVRGRGLARSMLALTWLRLGAVFVALAAVVLTVGVSAVAVVGIVLAVGDAFGGFVLTGVAARRTRDG
jgi:hypothetical protein